MMGITAFHQIEMRKCVTFFSWLYPEFRHMKIDYKAINVEFLVSIEDYPLNEWQDVLLSMHSPNSLPSSFMQLPLKSYQMYNYHVSKTQIHLLGDKYDTNCFNYDLDYKFQNFNMRSDCIQSCYQDRFRYLHNDTILCPNEQLLREAYLYEHGKYSTKKCNRDELEHNTNMLKNNEVCQSMCKLDCTFEYYDQRLISKQVRL